MLRILLLLLMLMLALPCGAADQRPNVLLITVDTFRPDHLGYYGYPHPTSPHLDSLASEGVFFKQAFTSSGWTSPGLISILSGLYAPTHGVDIRSRELDPDVTTLPDAFRAAGYCAPDIFFLTDIANFANLGFEPYAGRDRYIHDGDQILFKWLAEEAPRHQPFFLYYHYRELHLPYDPKPVYESMFMPPEYGPGFSLVGLYRKFMAGEKIAAVKKNVMLVRGAAEFTSGDQPWVEALYDGQIRQLDEEFFAPLRQTLKELGLDRNTLVVISADHGEELLDHDLVGHVSTFKEARLFDEVIRIPLIFWYPGVLPAGRVVEEPVQCIDILPTLMELIGQPSPLGSQGASLVPLLRDQPGWKERPIYCETSGGGFTADDEQYHQRVAAVRTERWKLLHHTPSDELALYDLATDPRETDDVLSDHPEVGDSLRTLLNQWLIYTQRRPYHQTLAPVAPTVGLSGPPQILFPADGDTLSYQGDGYSIQPRWTGDPRAEYVIEYQVGKGAYHLEGEIPEKGTAPSYGPFQETFWNSLSMYNPWRFRVHAQGHPEQSSAWTTFYLGSTHPEVSFSLAGWLWLGWRGLQDGAEQVVLLVKGLGLGLVDLYLWVAQIPPAELSAYALLLAIVAALAWPRLLRFGVERSRAWGMALLYIAFVYSTIPLMPQVWRTLIDHTQGAVRYLGIVVVVGSGIALVLKVRPGQHRRWQTYTALLAVGLAYAYMLQRFALFPAERLHLVEYGLVGYFLHRALSLDLPAPRAYIVALLLTALVGTGDELIQWVSPERVFEVKDVQLNIVSGGLGLLVVRLTRHGSKNHSEDDSTRSA